MDSSQDDQSLEIAKQPTEQSKTPLAIPSGGIIRKNRPSQTGLTISSAVVKSLSQNFQTLTKSGTSLISKSSKTLPPKSKTSEVKNDKFEHKSLIGTKFKISEIETHPNVLEQIRNRLLQKLEDEYNVDKNLLALEKCVYNTNELWELVNLTDIGKIYNKLIARVPDIYDQLFLIFLRKNRNSSTLKKKSSSIKCKDFTRKQLDNAQIDSYSARIESRVEFGNCVDDKGDIQNPIMLNKKIQGAVQINYFKLNIKAKVVRALIVAFMESLESKKLI